MGTGFEITEHTAEVGIAAHGTTLAEVLEQASLGLCSVMWRPASVRPRQAWPVAVASADREALVVDWLNALLVVIGEHGVALHDVRVDEAWETGARGLARGEPLDAARHGLRLEVKAATYHALEVAETGEGLRARVILDV